MLSQSLSFTSTLFPVNRRLAHHDVSWSTSLNWVCLLPDTKESLKCNERREACISQPKHRSTLCQLSPLTAALAAIAVLTSEPGSSVASMETNAAPVPSNTLMKDSPDDRYHYSSKTPQGTLLRVHPSMTKDAHVESSDIIRSQNSARNNTTPYSHSTAGLQGWARTRLHHAMRASRPPRLIRVRPATLGLVGVGAFTSGSVFLRSITRNTARRRGESFLSTRDVCSVVSMQIPFCISERAQMLHKFDELAKSSSINDAEGMARASRGAAAVLLEEEGLLEDSTKFAPYIDVFLAENLVSAERRFAGHVATEESRLQKIENTQAGAGSARQGIYGVVTMVVATMEGVDLACYDEHSSLVSRLRHALDSISKLRGGEVAGLELVWVPETGRDWPLTRAQISDAYPWLKVG